jgi:hypothetical protein
MTDLSKATRGNAVRHPYPYETIKRKGATARSADDFGDFPEDVRDALSARISVTVVDAATCSELLR